MVHRGSPVKSMREFPDRELKWTQPKLLKGYFELLCGDDRIGTLRWEKSFGWLATAEVSEGQWTFERSFRGGFLPHVTVRESGSAETIAMFEANWSGGSLQYRGGQRIRWVFSVQKWTSLLRHYRGCWVSENGLEIARFSHPLRIMKHEGRLEVSTHGAGLPELPLLALLGWYLMSLGFAPLFVEIQRQTITQL